MGEVITKGPFKEDVILTQKLSSKYFVLKQSLFFIDENLKDHPALKFISNQAQVIYLKGGENTKSLKVLQSVLVDVQSKIEILKPPYTFVAIGGGSVGDFCGFLASVYHRGVRFIQCPSTWLAAIDSAHGGKNALNVAHFKNQVGTFYPASKIIIAFDFFKKMPLNTAMGEILKTALLSPSSSPLRQILTQEQTLDAKWLWGHLWQFIAIKNTIVKKDPFEKSGERFKLNFGHTVGHAIENLAGYSHSDSVLWGLLFAIRWSVEKKLTDPQLLEQVYKLLFEQGFDFEAIPQFTKDQYRAAILKDKKRKSADLSFVFYQNKKAVVIPVTVNAILTQLQKQGYILP